MSKTVDELRDVYSMAYQTKLDSYDYDETAADCIAEAERAGIAAVIRALRDEIVGYQWAENKLNEILGDTAEARSAGVLAVESREGAMISEAPEAPATAPAPAVCVWKRVEWTPLMSAHWTAECSDRAMWSPDWARCPSCKAPIKFTEAK